jgi:hypothetical protein
VEKDPLNLLLHHYPLRRLEGEAVRDKILAISGRLDRTVGGPSVEVFITEFHDGRGKPKSGPHACWRRMENRKPYLQVVSTAPAPAFTKIYPKRPF